MVAVIMSLVPESSANRGATLYFDVLGSLEVSWNCNPKKLKPGTSALELAHMTMKFFSRSLQLFSTKTS
jgi:hypothetical protein